jgi:hypothetical protein
MTRFAMVLFVCMCAVVPTPAYADDGGWLDWLYRLDPKFWGIGTDVHLLCLAKEGDRYTSVKCENWFRNFGRILTFQSPRNEIEFDRIEHEINFRVGYYRTYGSTFEDSDDPDIIHAFKLMGVYYHHFNNQVALGGGVGFMLFDGAGFDLFSRGIVTPLSLVIAPSRKVRWLTFRIEESYINQGLTGADFGNPSTTFAKGGEWNFSFAIAFDFRRLPVRKQ